MHAEVLLLLRRVSLHSGLFLQLQLLIWFELEFQNQKEEVKRKKKEEEEEEERRFSQNNRKKNLKHREEQGGE